MRAEQIQGVLLAIPDRIGGLVFDHRRNLGARPVLIQRLEHVARGVVEDVETCQSHHIRWAAGGEIGIQLVEQLVDREGVFLEFDIRIFLRECLGGLIPERLVRGVVPLPRREPQCRRLAIVQLASVRLLAAGLAAEAAAGADVGGGACSPAHAVRSPRPTARPPIRRTLRRSRRRELKSLSVCITSIPLSCERVVWQPNYARPFDGQLSRPSRAAESGVVTMPRRCDTLPAISITRAAKSDPRGDPD